MKKLDVQVQCCFTSTGTMRIIRDGEPRTATSTFTQLLNYVGSLFNVALRPQEPQGLLWTRGPGLTHTQLLRVAVQCCFTSTETIRVIRDGELRTATSTFTPLLTSEAGRIG